ncbi:hypothetical protein E2R68_12440 [Psychromonas sp. RZ22]|uniref:hypothetical protein n=1 Tax=Psychromonas algarum TaxID=2555643 RepID=UPI0010688414|nr:hypothetical protein [Psychromonas sp. RZ22]TEW53502.1 hypothetical protein E2R68_12440 [Psychromonas sp. RZ22]
MSDDIIKLKARSLANYKVCEQLANESGDLVMAYYYAEMLKNSDIENEVYTNEQGQVIAKEEVKSLKVLNQIDSASMLQLCQNRFAPISRQYYKTQLENKR